MKTIYTVGTSNRTLDDFGNLLHHYGIQTLVDVRRFPTSRFTHFKKENLESFCYQQEIAYHWMGTLLGGFRSGSYDLYCQTDNFKDGLKQVEQLALADTTGLCCAERLPWECHRRFIANQLEKQGWNVLHIIDEDSIWKAKQTELF
ncbi:MAG: DUF488 domain-containing protein [Deltaproteobacteria bacterium]|nr:DUF488 domain-containing protein [Deltaproteobacteria bacterium]